MMWVAQGTLPIFARLGYISVHMVDGLSFDQICDALVQSGGREPVIPIGLVHNNLELMLEPKSFVGLGGDSRFYRDYPQVKFGCPAPDSVDFSVSV